MYLQRIRVKFVYKGDQVKVKFTGAKRPNACLCIAHHRPTVSIRIHQMGHNHCVHPVCNFYRYLPDGAALQTTRRCWSYFTLRRMLNNVNMTNHCSTSYQVDTSVTITQHI